MSDDAPKISKQEFDTACLYEAFIDRYERVPGEWSMPMTAVRLLAKRAGLDPLLRALEAEGAVWIVGHCRRELVVRQKFFSYMIARYPTDDPADKDAVAAELSEDLATFDSPAASTRLLRFLGRLLRRRRAVQPARCLSEVKGVAGIVH